MLIHLKRHQKMDLEDTNVVLHLTFNSDLLFL